MHEKIFKISNNILCAVAGITSDANVMIDELRQIAARYRESYSEDMPLEQLVRRLADIKQHYTQVGGLKHDLTNVKYPKIKANVHSVFPFCTLAGTRTTASKCTNRTQAGITRVGMRPALARTTPPLCRIWSRSTRPTRKWHWTRPNRSRWRSVKITQELTQSNQFDLQVLSKNLDVKPNVDKLEVAELKMVDNKLVMRYLTNEEVQQLIMENEQLAQEQE